MKLGIISDLHLEFRSIEFMHSMIDTLNKWDGDKLIIAGDTHSNDRLRDDFFSQLEKPYFAVMGNHDYYHSELSDDFKDEDGIVGGCLWSNFDENPLYEQLAGRHINDFRYIAGFTTTDCKDMFYDHFEGIMQSPSDIVVTHFSPSLRSTSPEFYGNVLNAYFMNDLDEYILGSDKKLWIHGHVHSRWDYVIGNCRIIANPLGYPNEIKETFSIKEVMI